MVDMDHLGQAMDADLSGILKENGIVQADVLVQPARVASMSRENLQIAVIVNAHLVQAAKPQWVTTNVHLTAIWKR
eukprot:gene22685-2426_t